MRRLIHLVLGLSLILGPWFSSQPGFASEASWQGGEAARIMANMTPEEKVGQLFLVTFYGPAAGPEADIERLITQYHVGGAALMAAHDNITDTVNAPAQVLTLTNQLQASALGLSQVVSGTPAPPASSAIPLFIALRHEGGGYPFTEIHSGLTELPDAMAIGATWDPRQAEEMGRITGAELSALGINLLLGPPLDVLDSPHPQGGWDLGPRAFGGDPFWVGLVGQAYIRGVHAGSDERVAVVATHFPGLGSSNRNPEEEVPTVRKSLDQLEHFDLMPFFVAAGGVTDTLSTADALLTTHIRFQGFQGNPRQTTSPVSLDPQALGQLLALPELAPWREKGGVTMSDSLGVRALKRFYDPNLQSFPHRRIAREAFDAGNDILFLSEFGLNPRQDQIDKIIDTLTYFTQQYRGDKAFAEKVDAAVERILTLKLRLYGQFTPAAVERPASQLGLLGQGEEKARALAQAAATLISLTSDEQAARVPPAPNERIVFFTDTRPGRQCAACPAYPLLDKRHLEREVVKLYGPSASGQVREGNLQSFSFDDLAAYLSAAAAPPPPGDGTPTPTPSPVEAALTQANWIVFGMLNVTPDVPNSGIVSTFLARRPDIVGSKKVVVFAFNAPYYLDTTDLGKLTAFYALYSQTPAFVETAARLLFHAIVPKGFSPVSVQSIGYDLSKVTTPDPNQVIQIFSDQPQIEGTGTPQPAGLKKGDVLRLRTGIIFDHNGHAVPDGTPVRFLVQYQGDDLPGSLEVTTRDGTASTTLPLNRIGQLQITAVSEPALASFTLRINVQETPSVITIIAPTATDTPTSPPTPTVTPFTPTATAQVTPTPEPPHPPRVAGRDFFMMCLGLVVALVTGYRFGTAGATRTQRTRVALAGAIGVLVGYNFFALGLPGAEVILPVFGVWAASVYVLLGAVIGLVVGWYGFIRRAQLRARGGGRG